MAEIASDYSASPPPPPPHGTSSQEVGAPLEVSVVSEEDRGSLEQYPMTEAIRAVTETGVIRHAGTKILIQAITQLRESDLKDARTERQIARADVERYREDYFDEHTRAAVLQERLRGDLKVKKLQNVLLTLGGILLGTGLQPLFTTFSVSFFVISLLGLAMLLTGWFYPESRKEEKL